MYYDTKVYNYITAIQNLNLYQSLVSHVDYLVITLYIHNNNSKLRTDVGKPFQTANSSYC